MTGSPDVRRAPTIYDVAAAAGVSHQTVANVVNAPERVSPGTRANVEAQIARLGFRLNRVAQNLSDRRSRLIGFRVQANSTLSTGGILDSFLQSLAAAAELIDHHIVLFHSEPGAAEVAKAHDLYRANVADAFVLAETHPGDERVAGFVECELRFVAFGRTGSPLPHHWVDTDNVAGSAMATQHLLDQGHRVVAFVGWPEPSLVGHDRHEGWLATLTSHGIDPPADLVARASNDRRSAAEACLRLLGDRPDVTAVVAASDELALGVLEAADRLGRSVAVVGYDDSALATVGAGLSSVRQPIAEIASRIVAITAQVIAGEAIEPIQERVAPQLVVRASSQR
jgi:DNA-binding LacI/PurR family transcriptional regulator